MKPEILRLSQFNEFLKPRPRSWHKGNAGHVLIIGGEQGYSGAVRLAAEAALRVGAGLVSIATRVEHASLLNLTLPEIMCHAIHTAEDLVPLIKKATLLVIGPGLGQTNWSIELLAHVLQSDLPKLVDADGLNLLAKNPSKSSNWILTPHPGEASRLLNISTAEIQSDRLSAIQKIQSAFGGTVILKGHGSLVTSEDQIPFICNAGNPGMATAGMGDVLSGVIGGLVAQNIPMATAAKLGVLIHAMAGDLGAHLGERGMIASDLMPYLRNLVNP